MTADRCGPAPTTHKRQAPGRRGPRGSQDRRLSTLRAKRQRRLVSRALASIEQASRHRRHRLARAHVRNHAPTRHPNANHPTFNANHPRYTFTPLAGLRARMAPWRRRGGIVRTSAAPRPSERDNLPPLPRPLRYLLSFPELESASFTLPCHTPTQHVNL